MIEFGPYYIDESGAPWPSFPSDGYWPDDSEDDNDRFGDGNYADYDERADCLA